MTRLPLVVIGAGRLGRIHARLAAAMPEVELVGVVDPSEVVRAEISRELNVPTASTLGELSRRPQAAVVAAPTRQHYELCRELLEADVNVLVEKPMTATASDARRLVSLARHRRLVLQVGHVERFNPAFVAARTSCQEPCYIAAVRTSGYTCRSIDVGVVLDLMIHDLDLVLSLVNSPLTAVQAAGASVFGPHEDLAQARLTFANGCVANLTASRVSHSPERQLDVYQPGGCVSIDFTAKTAMSITPAPQLKNGLDVAHASEAEREQIRTRLFEDYLVREPLAVQDRNAIGEELRDFAQCIRTGSRPQVCGEAGCRAVEIAEWIQEEIAAYQSTLHRPITLPLPPHRVLGEPPRRQAG